MAFNNKDLHEQQIVITMHTKYNKSKKYELIASHSLYKCISPNKIMSRNKYFLMMTS